MKTLLKDLLEKPAVNGYETFSGLPNFIRKTVATIPGVRAHQDILGNLIATKGNGEKKILIEAHIDEVGFLITQITSKTKGSVTPIGDMNAIMAQGASIVINRFDKKIGKGLIGKNFSVIFSSTMRPNSGDWCYFERNIKINKNIISSPALDNRVGCAALIELLREPIPASITLTVLFGTQHEQGTRTGAYDFIRKIKPDLVIIVDSAYARPDGKKEWCIPELGEGPAIQLMGKDFVTPGIIVEKIIKAADNAKISCQFEIPDNENGGTNASRIPNNTPFGVINIPVRSQHTATSYTNINDIENTTKLLSAVLNDL